MRSRMSRNQQLVTLLEEYAQGEMEMDEFEERRRDLFDIDEDFDPETVEGPEEVEADGDAPGEGRQDEEADGSLDEDKKDDG